ncbi:MAG: purine-binding chemotaxis protein CheW [Rhodospirillaceae bacterium]|nr:purine-binding chemotaxis protein CheW [Rhodospirillaceae bacterium]
MAVSDEGARVGLVLFDVADRRFALDLRRVDRIIPMVEITPLPDAPRVAAGIINLHGEILPVLDVRQRLGLAAVAPRVTDLLLIARTSRRTVAISIDSVSGTEEFNERLVTPVDSILPESGYVEGVVATAGGALLIQDIDRFMSLTEERRLGSALEALRDANIA